METIVVSSGRDQQVHSVYYQRYLLFRAWS